ncbi:plasma membrane H+-ATPase [Cladochytrium tenue]|nr:plasma membrane H+-ATPase [Cladochytrium tenue]
MTGDGVNDAPSLKKADTGIAVEGASDAARTAADIVFLAPGLGAIIHSVRTARQIFHRMVYRIALSLHLEIFLATSLVILNRTLNVSLVVFLAIFADLATLAIAYDRAPAARRPARWDLRQIWGGAAVLGVLLAAGTWAVYGALLAPRRGVVQLHGGDQPVLFLEVALTESWLIFVTRAATDSAAAVGGAGSDDGGERGGGGGGGGLGLGGLLSPPPSWQLVGAVLAVDVVATLFCVFGWFTHGDAGGADIVTAVRVWLFSFGVMAVITAAHAGVQRCGAGGSGKRHSGPRARRHKRMEDLLARVERTMAECRDLDQTDTPAREDNGVTSSVHTSAVPRARATKRTAVKGDNNGASVRGETVSDEAGFAAAARSPVEAFLARFAPADIPRDRLEFSFSRSSGPGGQNVNKVNTKAEVRFKVYDADWMPEEVRRRLAETREYTWKLQQHHLQLERQRLDYIAAHGGKRPPRVPDAPLPSSRGLVLAAHPAPSAWDAASDADRGGLADRQGAGQDASARLMRPHQPGTAGVFATTRWCGSSSSSSSSSSSAGSSASSVAGSSQRAGNVGYIQESPRFDSAAAYPRYSLERSREVDVSGNTKGGGLGRWLQQQQQQQRERQIHGDSWQATRAVGANAEKEYGGNGSRQFRGWEDGDDSDDGEERDLVS